MWKQSKQSQENKILECSGKKGFGDRSQIMKSQKSRGDCHTE